MTEEPTTDPTAPTDQTQSDHAPPSPTADESPSDDADEGYAAVEYLQFAAIGVLVLVALVATFRLYFSVSAAVDTFVTRRYRPLFMAGFNLVVLLGCGIGLSALVRRLA